MSAEISNGDRGTTFETNVCELTNAEDVSNEGGDYRHVDAITPDGDRLAIKVARFRLDDDSGRRRGRYWIPRVEIETCDRYAFGVYYGGGGIEEVCRFYPAAEVKSRCPSFVPSSRREIDEVSRPPWSTFISPSLLEQNGGDDA